MLYVRLSYVAYEIFPKLLSLPIVVLFFFFNIYIYLCTYTVFYSLKAGCREWFMSSSAALCWTVVWAAVEGRVGLFFGQLWSLLKMTSTPEHLLYYKCHDYVSGTGLVYLCPGLFKIALELWELLLGRMKQSSSPQYTGLLWSFEMSLLVYKSIKSFRYLVSFCVLSCINYLLFQRPKF